MSISFKIIAPFHQVRSIYLLKQTFKLKLKISKKYRQIFVFCSECYFSVRTFSSLLDWSWRKKASLYPGRLPWLNRLCQKRRMSIRIFCHVRLTNFLRTALLLSADASGSLKTVLSDSKYQIKRRIFLKKSHY